jgi:hypothetical protein
MISENVKMACKEDVDFIQSEIERHCEGRKTIKDFKALYGDGPQGMAEAMASLKHEPSGRELPCGQAALHRLRVIAERMIATFENSAAWNPKVLADRLRHTFLRFMMDDTYAQADDAVSEWLEQTVRYVQRRHRKLLHYLPCVTLNLGKLDKYTFGPLTFVKKAIFFAENSSSIASYELARERLNQRIRRNASPGLQHLWEKTGDRKKIGAVDAFREFADGIDWIAIVSVADCEHSISEQRAETALRIALSAMKLLLPEKDGVHLRVAGDPQLPMRKHRLSSINGKTFRTTGNIRFGSATVTEEWQTRTEIEAAPILAVCHLLVQQALDGISRSLGFQMALRAITWYADAVSDMNQETHLIKCVTAIEALILPPKNATKAAFVIRGALLAKWESFPIDPYASIANKLYLGRSDIAHGNIESLRLNDPKLSHDALEFTRRATLQFLLQCSLMKPLGSTWDGTRQDVLTFYRQLQDLSATEINAIVASHVSKASWKKLQAQT